jgi:hypothetical protein
MEFAALSGATAAFQGIKELQQISPGSADAPFREPVRQGQASAWWGHVPFAHWLIRVAHPRCLVELGTHNGVSYSAFCSSVQEERLDCTCSAVDTWTGDPQSGYYGPEVYNNFSLWHNAHFGEFSAPHRCTFDDALALFTEHSIDILHIDGLHTYEAVRHDFESWLPKLSY